MPPKDDTKQGEGKRREKQQSVEEHTGGNQPAHAVRISDYRRIPNAAVVVGVIGGLDNQLCSAVQGEGVGCIFD